MQERAGELHSILESIPQIAFTTRADGHIEFVNDQWLHYAPGKQEFPLTHPDDADLPRLWAKTVASGQALELEVRVRRVDSEDYRFHLLRAIPVREGDTIGKWVGTFTDIEDQKQAVKRKDEFISIASHELKTPLTTVKAYVQLLDRAIEGEDPTKLYVERALVQIQKLDNLIADLLDLSKIESGKLKFNKKPFSFETMLANAIEMIRQTYPDYRISRRGAADVEDYGIGIGKDHQANLFSKFYRVEEAASRFQGLGIGLYICAEIIRRHEGEYGVESEPGKGSAFYFTVPLNTDASLHKVAG